MKLYYGNRYLFFIGNVIKMNDNYTTRSIFSSE